MNNNLKHRLRHAFHNVSVGKNMFIQGCVISLLMAVLISTNFWSINIMNNQLIESKQKMLNLYMNQIDERLYNIENEMAGYIVDNASYFTGVEKNNKNSPFMSKKLDTSLGTTFAGYLDLSGVFIYNTQFDKFISSNISDSFYRNQSNVADWFKKICMEYESTKTPETRQWICRKIGNNYCLIRFMKSGHFYLGGYIKVDRLLKTLDDQYNSSYEHLIFKDENGNMMTDKNFTPINQIGFYNKSSKNYSLEDGSKFTSIERKSSISSLKLMAFHKNTALILGLQGMQIIVFLLSNIFLMFMGGLIWHTRTNLIKPITTLVGAMEQVKQGDMEVQVEGKAHYNEFQILFNRFNSMVSEIKALKIDVYEKKIDNQRTMLKFLKLQINPHFFLNSLNVIYSLALTQNITVIKDMVMRLTKHSRYVLKITDNQVNIKDEFGYVDNFIEIQKIRYSFRVKYNLVTDGVTDFDQIPPMLIYTFIENAIKYGLREDIGEVDICVKVQKIKLEEKEYLQIHIEDNGKGFSSENLLALLNNGEIIIDSQGEEHYGIANVKHRLEIIYGSKASIHFSNKPQGGALIQIIIPCDDKI